MGGREGQVAEENQKTEEVNLHNIIPDRKN